MSVDRNLPRVSSHPVFLMFFFPPCRCCRAHVSRYSAATGAGQQAAVLSPVVAQYGAAASAVHCVCGAQCESRSPGGGATTLTAQSGAAQHENTVVSHFMILIVSFKGYLLSERGFWVVDGWRGGCGAPNQTHMPAESQWVAVRGHKTQSTISFSEQQVLYNPTRLSPRLPFWKLLASVDSGPKVERELRTFSNRMRRHQLGQGIISLNEHSTNLLSEMVCT